MPQKTNHNSYMHRKGSARARAWLEFYGVSLQFNAGEIIRKGDLKDGSLCRLQKGAAKLKSSSCAASCQILDFLFPGDFFFMPTPNEGHLLEAIIDDTVVISYQDIEIQQSVAPKILGKSVYDALMTSPADRFHRQIRILSCPTPAERCIAFLKDMAIRLRGCRNQPVLLPICLSDISAYLAITPRELEELLKHMAILGTIKLLDEA